MMKATLLLLALVVSANGLGFPNFNLGCPFGQAGRFSSAAALGGINSVSQLGVIPYCRVVAADGSSNFAGDLTGLNARPGYSPVYEPAPGRVIIQPTVGLGSIDMSATSNTAYPGVLVSVSNNVRQLTGESFGNPANLFGTERNPDELVPGQTVGFRFQGCNTFGTNGMQFVAGLTTQFTGLGLTTLVACPVQNILGHFEYANRAGGSFEGRAQGLTIPRPYIFYGL